MKAFLALFFAMIIPLVGNSSDRHSGGYKFVKNFELQYASVEGKIATFLVSHPPTNGPTRFEVIHHPACAESYPEQCGATIVRLDLNNSGETEACTETTHFTVDLEQVYGANRRVNLTVKAPNKRVLLNYVGATSPPVEE